ncbi:hypothetical protein AB0D27_01095 [Streptomyces sp. NPDC048415]|uniref:hypothetical protein n=1 Tax=Streptomyces sp. NPDC048415 TaxID=3154822 RepID=UPI00344A1EB1
MPSARERGRAAEPTPGAGALNQAGPRRAAPWCAWCAELDALRAYGDHGTAMGALVVGPGGSS